MLDLNHSPEMLTMRLLVKCAYINAVFGRVHTRLYNPTAVTLSRATRKIEQNISHHPTGGRESNFNTYYLHFTTHCRLFNACICVEVF